MGQSNKKYHGQSVGYSAATASKQVTYEAILDTAMRIVRLIQKKKQYAGNIDPRFFLCDAFAGMGVHPKTKEEGSVLIADRLSSTNDVDLYGVAIERDDDTVRALRSRLGTPSNWHILHASNEEALTYNLFPPGEVGVDGKPQRRYGLIYCDPNSSPTLPLAALQAFYTYRQGYVSPYNNFFIDLLICVSATQIKRVYSHPSTRSQPLNNVTEILTIKKRHWYVREPISGQQWTFFFGTNWEQWPEQRIAVPWSSETRPDKILHMVRTGSTEGRAIMHRLSTIAASTGDENGNGNRNGHDTSRVASIPLHNAQLSFEDVLRKKKVGSPYRSYNEYLRHPLFLRVKRVVIARAHGLCEYHGCGKPYTEVHHLVYPPWGTFDVPENMIAICHACHSRIHGKP